MPSTQTSTTSTKTKKGKKGKKTPESRPAWEWAEVEGRPWLFQASRDAPSGVIHARVYQSGGGFEAEAEVEFAQGSSVTIRGGGILEDPSETQKVAEIIGDWLATGNWPVGEGPDPGLYPHLWNRKLIHELLHPAAGPS